MQVDLCNLASNWFPRLIILDGTGQANTVRASWVVLAPLEHDSGWQERSVVDQWPVGKHAPDRCGA